MNIRARALLIPVVLLVTLTACPPPAPPPEAPPNDEATSQPPTAYLPGVPAPRLIRANAERGPDQEELPVLRRVEEPREVDRETRQNPHQPQEMDTLYVYYYDGLVLDFMRTHLSQEIIRSIEITHDRYETPEGVRVGMTRDEVHAQMGEPDETEADEERYFFQINEVGPEELVAVEYRNDRVLRLRYGFYVD